MKKRALLLTAFLAVFALFVSCKAEVVTGETIPTVTGISVYANPTTTDYAVNTALDLTGLIVSAKYSNGVTGIITDYTTEPADGAVLSKTGKTDVTVKYKELTAFFSVNVVEALPSTEPVLTGISVLQEPAKTIYAKGDTLDLANLLVCASYNDNKSNIVTDYTTEPAADSVLDETGDKEVVVKYKDFTATFKVSVYEKNDYDALPSTEAVLKEITILQKPSKLIYEKGDGLDLTGLFVGAKYSDGKTTIVTDTGYTSEPAANFLLDEAGNKEIVISYEGFTASFYITVYEKLPSTEAVLKEIIILQEPSKKIYTKDETLDLTGLFVGASYSDNKTSIITDYTATPAAGDQLTETGDQTVKISFGGFEASFTIKVVEQLISQEVYLESISVYQRPVKLSYEEGDAFDSTGLIVTGTYSDGLIGLISDYTLSILDGTVLSEKGTHTVTVTKGSLNSSFTFEVVEKVVYGTVSGISVTVAANSDISISQEAITNGIKLTAPEGFASYRWQVNSVTTGTEQEYILNTADLITGTYEIFLVVKDENNNYKSATIYIQVE